MIKMTWMYVLDTSALIDLESFYPKSIFPKVWKAFDGLVKTRCVVAPKQVSKEVVRSKFLREWCVANKSIFITLNQDNLDRAREISNEHTTLIKQNRFGQQADPFIIALAIDLKRSLTKDKPIIITQENRTKHNKIPHVARLYGVESDRLIGLFAREGWKF